MSQIIESRPGSRHARVRTLNEDPSKTVQSDAHRADIKQVLAQYEATGVLANLNDVDLQFRDVSEFTDYADLMQQNKEAEAEFMRLPSKVREVFEHDHTVWLDAAHDGITEEQAQKLVRLGVLEEVKSDAEAPASPAPEASPTSPSGASSES